MTGEELNKKLKIGAKHALYREDGKWYHHLNAFPGILFDKNGHLSFQNKTDYLENILLQHKKDLHPTNGISAIPGYIPFTIEQRRTIAFDIEKKIDEETIRVIREIEIIKRNRKLVDKIKKLYDNSCQICGIRLEIRKNIFYSEVHHIKPLGTPHNGPDILENMLCVCPNHHVLLDCFAIKLELNKFKFVNHKIGKDFLEYYNLSQG